MPAIVMNSAFSDESRASIRSVMDRISDSDQKDYVPIYNPDEDEEALDRLSVAAMSGMVFPDLVSEYAPRFEDSHITVGYEALERRFTAAMSWDLVGSLVSALARDMGVTVRAFPSGRLCVGDSILDDMHAVDPVAHLLCIGTMRRVVVDTRVDSYSNLDLAMMLIAAAHAMRHLGQAVLVGRGTADPSLRHMGAERLLLFGNLPAYLNAYFGLTREIDAEAFAMSTCLEFMSELFGEDCARQLMFYYNHIRMAE